MFIVFSIVTNLTAFIYLDNKEFFDEVDQQTTRNPDLEWNYVCLLYTSDAADE